MARGRLISRCLSTSRKFGTLPGIAGKLAEFCQSLYPLIVVHSDDFGRMSGDAWTVKFQVHPSSPRPLSDFEAALAHLQSAGLIQVYGGASDDSKVIQVNDFDTHQPGLHKRTASKFPESPGISRGIPQIPSEQNRTEQNRREEKGTEGKALTVVVDRFDEWYALYPRKKAPQDAKKAWAALHAAPDLQATIVASLRAQLPEFATRPADRVPYPATWLRGGQWKNEPDAPPVLGVTTRVIRHQAEAEAEVQKQEAPPPTSDDELTESDNSVRWFLESYPVWYAEERYGARYHPTVMDFQHASKLVTTWPERERLEKLARIYLRSVVLDKQAFHHSRSIAKFAGEASAIDADLREHGQ